MNRFEYFAFDRNMLFIAKVNLLNLSLWFVIVNHEDLLRSYVYMLDHFLGVDSFEKLWWLGIKNQAIRHKRRSTPAKSENVAPSRVNVVNNGQNEKHLVLAHLHWPREIPPCIIFSITLLQWELFNSQIFNDFLLLA